MLHAEITAFAPFKLTASSFGFRILHSARESWNLS
jgi:hypothetical protein